ncbi:MAG TPA: amino acid ABC transporter permease [Ktedonobacteraceae bacterium]|jgi:glutamine transport system permease protein|nr:amino acid ABC transporter permease [Ktedonobacteraceae bacterium]
MDLLMTWLPAFLVGARNTLIYCCISFPLALLLGLMLAEMKNARYVWLSMPAKLFIEAFRNTPIITQIFLIYYGVGGVLTASNLAHFDNAWVAGVACLTLNYAAYEAEVFRAGFLSVERGQSEAAYSLGLSAWHVFRRIIFPQAVPLMLPTFVNDFIYMLKDSAIVAVISGSELTSTLLLATFRNPGNTLPLFSLALALYLAMSLPISFVARYCERRLRAAF